MVFNRTQRPTGNGHVFGLVRTIYFIGRKVKCLPIIVEMDQFIPIINCFRRHLALQSLDKFDDDEDSLRKFYRNSKHEVSSAEWAICEHSQEYCALAVSFVFK